MRTTDITNENENLRGARDIPDGENISEQGVSETENAAYIGEDRSEIDEDPPISDEDDLILSSEAEEDAEREQFDDKEKIFGEISISQSVKKGLDVTKTAGKKSFSQLSSVFGKESMKSMFFGSVSSSDKTAHDRSDGNEEPDHGGEDDPNEIALVYNDENDDDIFGNDRRKPIAVEADSDKKLFEIEYTIDRNKYLDGHMLYYTNFTKKSNIKWTVALFLLAAASMAGTYFSSENYLNYLAAAILVASAAIKWLNYSGDKKNAAASSAEINNSVYKLSFFYSRIVIEERVGAEDTGYMYAPVTIRFEDIDLKVIDYEDIYVLIFKRDCIYVLPKGSMTQSMNERFKSHLENILGEDYHEFYDKNKKKRQSKINEGSKEDKEFESE